MVRVAVVGAGVVGLSTAVCLQRHVTGPDDNVTVLADGFLEQTTSHGAAGIFRPGLDKTPGVPLATLRRWCRDSFSYLHELARSEHAGKAGVSFLSGYSFSEQPPVEKKPLVAEFAFNYRDVTEHELGMFAGSKFRHGACWSSLLCDCSNYLPYLTEIFTQNGGIMRRHHVDNLADLCGHYDVVVNCAGLGNMILTRDHSLLPIRGHLIRVKAPWIKNFVYCGDSIYIIPTKNSVAIGGTRQRGRSDRTPLKADHDVIWRNACTIMPSLKHAEVLHDWVGLRPFREPLRLEAETLSCPGGATLQVVHNYGHGAEGVGLAWGTAINSCQLVHQSISRLQGTTGGLSKL